MLLTAYKTVDSAAKSIFMQCKMIDACLPGACGALVHSLNL